MQFPGLHRLYGADPPGIGVSSISATPQGYAQNPRQLTDCYAALDEEKLPTARGLRLTLDDRIRQFVIRPLQRHFFQLMSQEITQDQLLITILSKNSAEQRIAAFLLSISARNARRSLSGTQFRLPMSRTDIGNYLGLTVETVSRVFSRFQKNAVLAVEGKEIQILDHELLREIMNGTTSALIRQSALFF